MKIRNGFVSNSSSASFVIRKADITKEQLESIKKAIVHGEYSPGFMERGFIGYLQTEHDSWEITEDGECISGESMMDNGNIWPFFKSIGIDKTCVEFCGEDRDWENSDVD